MEQSETTRIEVPDMPTANRVAKALRWDEIGFHVEQQTGGKLRIHVVAHAPKDAVRRVLGDWELLRGIILGPA